MTDGFMGWLSDVFSADPTDVSRLNVWGLAVTVLGVAVYVVGPMIAKKPALALRFVGIGITIIGALMSMKII